MMKKTVVSVASSDDDMYVENAKEPVNKGTGKGIGKSTKGFKPDLEKEENLQKEKLLQARVHDLEEEVIKLQLQNNLLTVATPTSG